VHRERVVRELLRQLGLTLLFTAAGVVVVLIPMVDPREDAFPAGRRVMLVAGLVLLLFGLVAAVSMLRAVARQSRGIAAVGAFALAVLLLPPVWIAVARGVFPGGPPPPSFEPVRLTVGQGEVLAGRTLRVAFDRPLRMPDGYRYWLAIVPPGAPVSHAGRFVYLTPGARDAVLVVPSAPGAYEIRLHAHLHQVIATLAITARAPPEEEVERAVEVERADDAR
jgi:hypothetical protein